MKDELQKTGLSHIEIVDVEHIKKKHWEETALYHD